MAVEIYTGLPATGKTSAIIKQVQARKGAGDEVIVFLSSEHEELTQRPNVRVGGMMGCRNPSLSCEIDHVCNTEEAVKILNKTRAGALAVFDEAHFFQPEIAKAWSAAGRRGVDVFVGNPSDSHLSELAGNCRRHHFEVDCRCGKRNAVKVVYGNSMTSPEHLCRQCHDERMDSEIEQLLGEVKAAKPFPGELHTYQPFYGVDMAGWQLVRGDSQARLKIVLQAAKRSNAVLSLMRDPVAQPTYLDLGCCCGFFAEGMHDHGFRSTGVDVAPDLIDWATRLSRLRGHGIRYLQADAHDYMTQTDDQYDVTSTFATIQWLMAQKGYAAGEECFAALFRNTRHVAVVEMGCTSEKIYSDRIPDAPMIDKDWVLKTMEDSGEFAAIEVHPAGENGIWRDIFVGFKEVPTSNPFRGRPFNSALVCQVSAETDFWEDAWASAEFEVWLRCKQPISQVGLAGWRNGDQPTDMVLSIDGRELARLCELSGSFFITAAEALPAGKTFRLSVSSSTPVQTDIDGRDLGFVLEELSFS